MRDLRLLLIPAILLLASCRQDMHDQPKYEPLAGTDFFADARSARPKIEDTVARGQLRTDKKFFEGKENGQPVPVPPIQITAATLQNGRTRFNVYCSPCHGQIGDGEGMVVQRGFKRPPSFHIDRLRQAPAGHFYDVITAGIGVMVPFNTRLTPTERWEVVAYIRALQLSQNARVTDVPDTDRVHIASEEVHQ